MYIYRLNFKFLSPKGCFRTEGVAGMVSSQIRSYALSDEFGYVIEANVEDAT